MKNKAIIFDLDGTAVDSPELKLPSHDLIKETQRLSTSYYLCAATGRVWSFAKPVLQSLKLTDPSIISAGTQICNPQTGKILWQKNFSQRALTQTVKIFQQYPDWKLLYNDGTEDDYFHGGIQPVDFIVNEPVYFLEQVFVPNQKAEEICHQLRQVSGIAVIQVVSQKPGCKDIHITNSQATKEHAIAVLLDLIGVSSKNTIGVGDGHNDIHLFNAVSYKVAMGNAVPELKANADLVIDSVKEDGLARYFKTL